MLRASFSLSSFTNEINFPIIEESKGSIKKKVILLINDSIPPAVAFLINQLIMTVNLYYVGNLNNTEIFNGVGFGSAWINLTNMTILTCLNVGFIAIGSQAYGSQNYELLGLYYHRAIIIAIIVFIPCSILIINSEPLILLLNIQPAVAKYAVNYMISLLPATFIYILNDATKNLLFCQNYFFLPAFIQFIVSMIHP